MLDKLIGPISDILDKFIPDADKKAKLAHEIGTLAEKQAHAIALAQIAVNVEEAKGNLFQSSWRPFVGWTCGIAFAYHFVVQPVLLFCIAAFGVTIPELPVFDMTSLLTVLGGLLGLGTLRSFEKSKGLTK